MENSITVAWAIPVNITEFGARLEAYVGSKAQIHAFKLCVKYAQIEGCSLGRLSPELVEFVAAYIGQSMFENHLARWQQAADCCSLYCSPSSHFNDEEMKTLRARSYKLPCCIHYDYNCEDEDCVEDFVRREEVYEQRHDKIILDYEYMLQFKHIGCKDSQFSRCREVVCPILKHSHYAVLIFQS